jgi:glycosyltransferase involved in cell wall biosynthesis
MRKKKILFHSNCSRVLTGFGKNAKNVISYLYKTGKYELVEVANGVSEASPALSLFPWNCIGSYPDDKNLDKKIESSQSLKSKAGYGHIRIDSIIEKETPDVYIGSEDIWAFNGFTEKYWWSHINTILWVTLDSTPILDTAFSTARNCDKFITWSHFPQKQLIENGVSNTECIHGPIDHKNFKKLTEEEKKLIRNNNDIDEDCFIIGFVFRNQLRKSVPNLLDGFLKFKKENPQSKPRLLLHTNWQEGWDIPKLLKEKNINNNDILTTYFCSKCKSYKIQPFASDVKNKGEKQKCKNCGAEKSLNTSNVKEGVNEIQLNEIYNLMDVYCHPFTSGGQEIPIQEAKLCELITLVTDYSCGEDCSGEESGGFPLSWHEYREQGTQFIKASTCPHSICSKLTKVFKMNKSKKISLGKKARKFVIDNYSLDSCCQKLMDIIDKMPYIEQNLNKNNFNKNLNYKMPTSCSDEDFILNIYENMLKVKLRKHSEVFEFLMKKIQAGHSREKIYEALKIATSKEKEHNEKTEIKLEDFLTPGDNKGKLAVVLPKSIGDIFMATSLLPDIHNIYPEYKIYFICESQYHEILYGNPYIHKVLPFTSECHDALVLEGFSNRKDRSDFAGYFDIAILLHINNQVVLNYTRNSKDRISLDLCTC